MRKTISCNAVWRVLCGTAESENQSCFTLWIHINWGEPTVPRKKSMKLQLKTKDFKRIINNRTISQYYRNRVIPMEEKGLHSNDLTKDTLSVLRDKGNNGNKISKNSWNISNIKTSYIHINVSFDKWRYAKTMPQEIRWM